MFESDFDCLTECSMGLVVSVSVGIVTTKIILSTSTAAIATSVALSVTGIVLAAYAVTRNQIIHSPHFIDEISTLSNRHSMRSVYNQCQDEYFQKVSRSSIERCLESWSGYLEVDENLFAKGMDLVGEYWHSLDSNGDELLDDQEFMWATSALSLLGSNIVAE